MKLFTKTLCCFIGVILAQSSLTIALLTSITRQHNAENALKELRSEAGIVRENYMTWKRVIWKTLLDIRRDAVLLDALRQRPERAFQQASLAYLEKISGMAGIDVLLLRYARRGQADIIPITSNNFSFLELQPLERRKPHPYLTAQFIGQQLCLIGIVGIESPGAEPLADLFLIKRLDREFCQQLIVNRPSQAAFFLNSAYLAGTQAMPFKLDAPNAPAYLIEMRRIGEHAAVFPIERVAEAQPLFLRITLSNAGYMKRLATLERAVWSVTALSAALAVAFGLLLSSTITRPIRKLLSAMQRIRAGLYDTALEARSRSEIGELVRGFNEMARKIHWDKERMQAYIHEITVLKDYNEKIIQSIRAGLVIFNAQGMVEKVNRAFVEQFGLNESSVLGKAARDLPLGLFDAESLGQLRAILRGERQEYARIVRLDRHQVYDLKGYPIFSHDAEASEPARPFGCVVVLENISKKIEFEEKIFQAEKLSSISMLSAGVAHEINNPLSSIMTNAQNLLEEESDAEKRVSLRWIEQETRRIAAIVRKLLEFSSPPPREQSGADVNQVISETLTLLSYSLKRTQQIDITTDLADGLPLASMSTDELKQVMLNLLKNAMQAIERQGEICVRTAHDASAAAILVRVEDSGCGISEELLPRIFDPFYTTKTRGDGTGLGLSVVYGLLTKYGGAIAVSSRVGTGTQAQLTLPVLAE